MRLVNILSPLPFKLNNQPPHTEIQYQSQRNIKTALVAAFIGLNISNNISTMFDLKDKSSR